VSAESEVVAPVPDPSLWYRAGMVGALLLAALLFLFWPTFADTAFIWQSDTYMHGLLVPGIVAWLLWRRREELRYFIPQPSMWGVVGLLLCGGVWLLGMLAHLAVVEQLAVWCAVSCVALTVLGVQVARALVFPLSYIVFAVPMGEELIPWLMDVTAWFTVSAVRITGIPVYQEGHLFQLPSGMFEVAKACSGIRYLIASVALGTLYAYLTYASYWRRAVFIVVSLMLPIVANGLRAYGIVLIAHYSNLKYAVGVDHFIYGWVFFGLVILLMFWLGAYWRQPERVLAARASASAPREPMALGVMKYASALAILIGTYTLGHRLMAAGDVAVPVALQAPELVGWQSAPNNDWQPIFSGHTQSINRLYQRDKQRLEVFVVAYARQAPGAELASSENTLYDRAKWSITAQFERDVALGDGRTRRLRFIEVGRPGAKRAIAYWYNLAGREANQWVAAKVQDVWARFLNPQGYAAYLVAVSTQYGEQESFPEALLMDALQQLDPLAIGVTP
jgi:exosortase A